MRRKVVIHYRDGAIRKGISLDFFPDKPRFHLLELDAPPGSAALAVTVADCKAIFFVNDFEGNPGRIDISGFPPETRAYGHRITVTFADGEVIAGTCTGCEPDNQGFFLIPADRGSNNESIFVVHVALTGIRED